MPSDSELIAMARREPTASPKGWDPEDPDTTLLPATMGPILLEGGYEVPLGEARPRILRQR